MFKSKGLFPVKIFIAILTASSGVFWNDPALASLPSKPLPTYEKIDTTSDITTVEIPENLINAWRGVYRLSMNPLLQTRSINLRQYLAEYISPSFKPLQQKRTFKFNPTAIYNWTGQLSEKINQPTQEPVLEVKDKKVVKFTPPQTGKELDRFNSTINIIEQLQQGDKIVALSVKSTYPKQSLDDLNNLGISEIIGRGESKFTGSPKNRQHNIKIGMEKMKGVIVGPGEEFSFNKYLGPVEASTGFLPELVIRADKGTIPEFGGGLCQVSSTVFRAAMNAGLKIIERRNHSYAVQYYAPQGTDATIYPGAADLRFLNDTNKSILIWPYLKEANYLIFDFYGAYDGRKVVLDKPIQWDKKADGSMKASWSRTIIYGDGTAKTDKYASLYKPPALFHKQNEFVPIPDTQTGDKPSPSPTTPSGTQKPLDETPKPSDESLKPITENSTNNPL